MTKEIRVSCNAPTGTNSVAASSSFFSHWLVFHGSAAVIHTHTHMGTCSHKHMWPCIHMGTDTQVYTPCLTHRILFLVTFTPNRSLLYFSMLLTVSRDELFAAILTSSVSSSGSPCHYGHFISHRSGLPWETLAWIFLSYNPHPMLQKS